MPINNISSEIQEKNWNCENNNSTQIRIASILNKTNINQAVSIFLQIVNESALRQINMLGLSEQEKLQIKNHLLPNLGSLVKILESNEGEAKNNNETHGYLLTPDVNYNTSGNNYLQDLINPEKTHIWIYLWRIPTKEMLIKTINHELNHLFLRYTIWNTHSKTKDGDLSLIFNQNKRFPIILECLWFLSWAESGIISWGFSQKQGLESAEEWSNWDMDNEYTIASILAKRILEVQLYFWNQTWSNNPDFIRYCQLVRSNLYRSIYSENKFEEIQSILKLKNKHFSITNFTLQKMLDWTWM